MNIYFLHIVVYFPCENILSIKFVQVFFSHATLTAYISRTDIVQLLELYFYESRLNLLQEKFVS